MVEKKIFPRTLPDVDTLKTIQVGIVASSFNEIVVRQLVKGVRERLEMRGVVESGITEVWVPGSFEIPLACDWLAGREHIDGVVALGAVIRGETAHFDYVSRAVTSGVERVALDRGKPVIFGVLTTDTVEQAMERASTSKQNRGADFADGLLEMINLGKMISG